eukprot:CAMPEP_0114120464 /NCGR_PEP_ID=MMETSP0043_2-20121206/6661_1 /TAXON_ID=464988 /ORGANISM="Hemiselmis andersenii, Strain CCMP644" /LENGTH=222 /DNA_ID=CAMNT_0001213085 /DNA_START=8 /DNA_END=676 /DNA_ORIENTATION=-
MFSKAILLVLATLSGADGFLSAGSATASAFAGNTGVRLNQHARSLRPMGASLRQRGSSLGERRGCRALNAMDVSVTLPRPLGIVFEEVEPGEAEGVVVASLEPGGNADRDGKILVGDKLISTSAVVMNDDNSALVGLGGSGAKTSWTRKMIPVGKATFQTVMGAIGSNTGRWGYNDVRLTLRRTAQSVPRGTETINRGDLIDGKKGAPLNKPKDDWEEDEGK